jgi:hypothetical protein
MTFRSILLAGAAAAVLALPAAAKPNGWFVGLSGGASTIERSDVFNVPGSPYPYNFPDEKADMDMGWMAAGTFGYRWASNWRLEVELGYRSNKGDLSVPTSLTVDRGDLEITEFTQFLNAHFDFPLSNTWTLSFGAGLGGDLISYDDTNLIAGFGYSGVIPGAGLAYDDDWVLAGQLIAQVGVMVTKQLELYADYRYLVADEPVFESTTSAHAISMEIDKHSLLIGLRYDLAADEAPYVPPPPPPMAPPPPPMKQFVVFFGFNKYNLTADAQAVVAEAASQAKSQGAASIKVIGHTDTSGSTRYNQVLSEKRAKSVSDELVRQGIAPGAISASGRGETELMVQTGDGVKEPQNRRATIDIK